MWKQISVIVDDDSLHKHNMTQAAAFLFFFPPDYPNIYFTFAEQMV